MHLSDCMTQLKKRRDQAGDDFTGFFCELWKIQEQITPRSWEPAHKEALDEAMHSGAPAFSVDSPVFDQEDFLDAFAPVIAYLADYAHGHEVPQADALVSLADKTIKGSLDLSDNVLEHPLCEIDLLVNELASEVSLEREKAPLAFSLLELGVVSALQPTAVEAAQQLSPPTQGAFDTGVCPVCGLPAALGILRAAPATKGSPRDLWCAFCETTWEYPRVRCTRCGNTVQEDIGFFFDEQDQGRRVYGCKKCGGTLKVASEQGIRGRIEPRLEELLMSELERAVIAQNADFARTS